MEQLLLYFAVIAIISLLYSVGSTRSTHRGPYAPLSKDQSTTSNKTV